MTSRRALALVGTSIALSAVACGIDAVGTAVDLPQRDAAAPTPSPTGTTDPPGDSGPDAELDAANDAGADATVDGSGDAGPIVFVQSVVTAYANGLINTATLTVTPGNTLVVATYVSGTPAMSVSDTLGNVFASATKTTGTSCSGSSGQLWYVTNAKGGVDVVSVTISSSAALGITVAEYSGVAATGALDVVSNAVAAASSNAMSAPSLTTTGSRDLIVSLFHDTNGIGTMTPGTGYTARARDTDFYTLLQDDAPGRGPGVRDVTAALPAGANDACWGALAIALKAP